MELYKYRDCADTVHMDSSDWFVLMNPNFHDLAESLAMTLHTNFRLIKKCAEMSHLYNRYLLTLIKVLSELISFLSIHVVIH